MKQEKNVKIEISDSAWLHFQQTVKNRIATRRIMLSEEVEVDPTVEADFIRRINEAIAVKAADDKAGRLHRAGQRFLCTTPQGWQYLAGLGRYVMVSGKGFVSDPDANILDYAKRFDVVPPDGWPEED